MFAEDRVIGAVPRSSARYSVDQRPTAAPPWGQAAVGGPCSPTPTLRPAISP